MFYPFRSNPPIGGDFTAEDWEFYKKCCDLGGKIWGNFTNLAAKDGGIRRQKMKNLAAKNGRFDRKG